MIFYFSGTGNSRYAAYLISRQISDQVISINDVVRQRISDPYVAKYAFESNRPLIFVCPTYCWRVPRIVEQFILDSRFAGSRDCYFFLTCGSGTGAAEKYAKELCKKAELNFMGLSSVKMPENYICMFKAPPMDEAQGIIRAAVSQIESDARRMASGRSLSDPNASWPILSRIAPWFYKYQVRDKKFYTKESCVSCGKCAAICPTANISLENGVPKWHGNCTHCQACISLCPENAIEYGSITEKKRRYFLMPDGRQLKP